MKTIAQIYAACDGKNVCFHIGRGGHFHNAGYKTFNPNVTRLQECFDEAMIIDQDEDGNELPADQWQLVDGGGNVILTGRGELRYYDFMERDIERVMDAVSNECWLDDDED